ncbi:hypothetical protein N3K66_008120 [Trichothecium roseum]|uniref:Uncharacterized protein n=1 Tax=Trichothecium roseum TaxID=47278 RepID=A0ACC0USX4_9HYPO|nr:hypothetical protein N3K66_008120 [Trichothecium roseum]
MRARFRGPSGSGIVEFNDDATVANVFDKIREQTGIDHFSVKYGQPTSMETLGAGDANKGVKSLKLHGETLIVVPEEQTRDHITPDPMSQKEPRGGAEGLGQNVKSRASENPEDINIPWPEREGTLLLRVMPSDNSCLFTAFGGALPKQIPAQQLRRMMADYISEHSDVYSEAILGSPVAQYCRSIQDPDRWGGGIELSILSNVFDIQICTYDVQAQNLVSFGEGKKDRCILVYSGIHYDRVAFTYSEYPHRTATLPPEMDRTVWPITDEEILARTQQLVQRLNEAHYYTDTDGLVLKCDVPGCEWIGSGQTEGQKHAEQTGHVDLSEIRDVEGENVLRSCDTPGCDFMGQGDGNIRRHRMDTGHDKFSVIPDF